VKAGSESLDFLHWSYLLTAEDVITLGRCGMVCAERTGATWHLPATPTEVRDVCGAGDTVLAALAVGMIHGKVASNSLPGSDGGGGKAGGDAGSCVGRVNRVAGADYRTATQNADNHPAGARDCRS